MVDRDQRSEKITRRQLRDHDTITILVDDLTKNRKVQINTKILNKLKRKMNRR